MAEAIHGTIIGGKYRLLALLGEGAMGVVYRAEQLDSESEVLREVALKMIHSIWVFPRPEFRSTVSARGPCCCETSQSACRGGV